MHSDNFKKYRKIKAKYDALYAEYEIAKKAGGLFAERKAQKALTAANEYYENNRPQIALFNNAEKYLRDVLQARFDPKKSPPINKWRKELAAKTAEQETLYREYLSLKAETQKVEQIQRSVKDILASYESERTPTKRQDISL